MSPTVFAMKHPITTRMLGVGLISGGAFACSKMRVDNFSPLNTPKIYGRAVEYESRQPEQAIAQRKTKAE